jgi:hypothetical protein
LLQLFVYSGVLGAAGIKLALGKQKGFLLWGLPLAISTMHMSWGLGFLWSGVMNFFRKNG